MLNYIIILLLHNIMLFLPNFTTKLMIKITRKFSAQ